VCSADSITYLLTHFTIFVLVISLVFLLFQECPRVWLIALRRKLINIRLFDTFVLLMNLNTYSLVRHMVRKLLAQVLDEN